MILSSSANVFVSPCEHKTKNLGLNGETASESRIAIVSTTERSSVRREIEGSYARYNKNKREAYKYCNFCCDNSSLQVDTSLPLTRLKLPKLYSHLVHWICQESIQPQIVVNSSNVTQIPCCGIQHTEADVYSSIVEQAQYDASCVIKSRLFLSDFQNLKFSNEFTSVYSKTVRTNCRYDYNCSVNMLHAFDKNVNGNKPTCANELSSGGFHHICCISSVSGKAKCSRDKTNVNNSKNSGKMRAGVAGVNGILNNTMHANTIHYMLLILLSLSQVHALLLVESKYLSPADDDFVSDSTNNNPYINTSIPSESSNRIGAKPGMVAGGVTGGGSTAGSSGYMDKMKMNNLEMSVAAVLKKVAYGTTSTTKRSIPDNSYLPSLTTIATPLLTTLRYAEKPSQQQQINHHQRNYELDLERDHALPTSAPNADILKSNSNPTYPNPNRHHNHERERHRHVMNSTPFPSIPNILKKNNGQLPTIPMYPGDIPSYSPPARSFFTPPLPPEYQNPFADKPTLRGTNNDGIIPNTGTYINRRPIPPPSLMPGHERIPFRPPDLAASTGNNSPDVLVALVPTGNSSATNVPLGTIADADHKKALNTPSRTNADYGNAYVDNTGIGGVIHTMAGDTNKNFDSFNSHELPLQNNNSQQQHSTRQEVLPSIRRILSGSNGKGDIPEVLLKQATSRPIVNYNQPPSSQVVLLDGNNVVQQIDSVEDSGISSSSNINKSKNSPTLNSGTEIHDATKTEYGEHKHSAKANTYDERTYGGTNGSLNGSRNGGTSTPSTAAAIGGPLDVNTAAAAATSTISTIISATVGKNPKLSATVGSGNIGSVSGSSGTSSSTAAAASSHSTWAVAWNIHVYFSVVLFTILAVYSLYKVFTYNKLTHLFSQSYFMCINMVLIVICSARIFYLCYDAYNIHATFSLFISELLLNLPATLLTISFSVLILYLFLKALNHKNNRYSALIRPLTVVVGCGVHVLLCVTLHYVESYTLQNQQQQHLLYQQQQQQLLYRRQQQHLLHQHYHQHQQQQFIAAATTNLLVQSATAAPISNVIGSTPPPKVLSLICQIIYIFVCLFLGLLYLYLYRILKRILRSKSQNYIHGYQNLSYAIHITIATALLFVLLAALQIFGAISISTTRSLMQQLTAENDWLQWGYQFSLRLIEIAIITLLSWVTGLKTSSSSSGVGVGVNAAANGDARYGVAGGTGGGNVAFGSGTANHNREKHAHHHFHHNHSNVAGFFLPCTSSSSQEQIDIDYPAVCNANTNLHTYTMRTGKLIYDDSFALNSLPGNGQSQLNSVGNSATPTVNRNTSEFQLQTQPTYRKPYDSGSINSAMVDHNTSEYGTQSRLAGGGGGTCGRFSHEVPQYTDYLTDPTTDHYENPNFDLRSSISGSGFGVSSANPSGVQKFTKTSTTSTTASSSGASGSSAASQQQMLLLQGDSCYSEPLQAAHTSSYDFNNFERPYLGRTAAGPSSDCWSESHTGQPLSRVVDSHKSKREKKMHTTLDRNTYENPERRSSNSTHSCSSSRYGGYNSFDRGLYNGVRKSGTLNNIVGNGNGGGHIPGIGIMHGRNSSSSSAASSNISAQHTSGAQTLALSSERHLQQQQRSGRGNIAGVARERDHNQDRENEHLFSRSSLDRNSTHPQHPHQDSDDMISPGSSVERNNLIDNKDGSCITNSSSTTTFCGGRSQMNDTSAGNSKTNNQSFAKSNLNHNTHSSSFMLQATYHNHQQQLPSTVNTTKQQKRKEISVSTANFNLGPSQSGAVNSGISNTSVTSTVSESSSNRGKDSAMLVAEHGFVRFRAIDDMNNAQGVGIHNASVRN